MAKYTISSDYGSVFGMDVHARSITVKGFDWATGEEKMKTFTDCPAAAEVVEWMGRFFTPPHYAAYESGCTGFHLCKEMRALGVDCDVVAVSSIARSSDDKRRKTDKKDANRLLAELISPKKDYSVVWVPDAECEALRDLARARIDAVVAVKRVKQQASALLLRHGHAWNEKTASGKSLKKTWGADYLKWISAIKFDDPADSEVLDFYKQCVKENVERVERIEKQVVEAAARPRWKPYVDALTLIKGIDLQTAFLLAVEFGDFHRFRNGRSVSNWLGTVPSEDSSGPHVVRGNITKAGNAHCRHALVEGVQSIGRTSDTMLKPKTGQRVSPEVVSHCHAATRRLRKRYRHLTEEQKIGKNKAKIAIVNELIRWVWAVGCMVQDEQASKAATKVEGR